MKVWSTGEQVLAADLNNNFKSAAGTSTLNTGTTNITHGLGTTPGKIKFTARFIVNNGWASNSVNQQSSVTYIVSGTITSTVLSAFAQNATNVFYNDGTSFSGSVAGRVLVNTFFPTTSYLTLSAVGATTFTLTWTFGAPGGTTDTITAISILWEAEA